MAEIGEDDASMMGPIDASAFTGKLQSDGGCYWPNLSIF